MLQRWCRILYIITQTSSLTHSVTASPGWLFPQRPPARAARHCDLGQIHCAGGGACVYAGADQSVQDLEVLHQPHRSVHT